MSESERFPRRLGHQLAGELTALLKPFCERVEVAGSLRREQYWIHDLDLVVFPRSVSLGVQGSLFGETQAVPLLRPAFVASFVEKHILPSSLLAAQNDSWPGFIRFTYSNLKVDLYLTQPTGCNFGALWQMRTGPAELNKALAAQCLQRGWSYRAGYGIFDGEGVRLDDDTETGIFRLLGLRFIPPPSRDGFIWGAWSLDRDPVLGS